MKIRAMIINLIINMHKFIFTASLCLVLVGCATHKVMQATGGSKSDGTVDLSFNYGMFEKPEVDWQSALTTAQKRCAAWGYKNAESFGGQKNSCQAYNGYGNCVNMAVTVTYQCTD